MTRRRAPHEGTIRKRADGRWEAVLHVGYEGGRRVRKSYYGKTRGEVHERLIAAQRGLQGMVAGIRAEGVVVDIGEAQVGPKVLRGQHLVT